MIKDVVLCEDCRYRPYKKKYVVKMESNGFVVKMWEEEHIESPIDSNICPCINDNGISSYIPADDWYCGNGAPK